MKSLGIDYGCRYIGLAIGYDDVVSPLMVIDNFEKNKSLTITKIAKIIKSENIELVVIGMPVNDLHDNGMGSVINDFIENIKAANKGLSNVKYIFVDESYTSKDALKSSINFGIRKKKRSEDHAVAACEILKRAIDLTA